MRQIILGQAYDCEGSAQARCSRGAKEMDRNGHIMFGNLGRSMLTVFQCFTDGCESASGTPLLWHLWDTHGAWLIIGYVGIFIFVTFGIFNLILAIFVENTLEYARVSDQRRASRRHLEHVRQAKKLQQLLVKICSSCEEADSPQRASSRRTVSKK